MAFTLHETLARDTVEITRWPLCRVLLIKDSRFPWLILVPEREGIREIHELQPHDRGALIEEIARAGESLQRLFTPDKLNVGALGNIVPQLHVHMIARSIGDPAWPGPVWGSGAAVPYEKSQLEALRGQLVEAFLSLLEKPVKRRDLSDIAGTCQADPEIDEALSNQRWIDTDLWR